MERHEPATRIAQQVGNDRNADAAQEDERRQGQQLSLIHICTELSPDDPPRLLQTGQPGLSEVTVRIVYRDGLEVERWPTATTVIEAARDEIVMIGVAGERDRMAFDGLLATIDDGRAILLDGATDAPRQIAIEGTLDGRVFQLSPRCV